VASPRPLLVALVLGALLCVPAAVRAGTPGDAVYRKLCRSIRGEHVRPLFTAPVAPIRLGGSSDCAFAPRGAIPELDGVRVFLRIDDGDQTLWKHLGDRSYCTFRSLSMTGGRAKWGYEGGRLPSVVDARTGTFTCTLIPAGTKGLAVPSGPPLAASRAYARRLLALCDDVFAAHR